MEMQTAVNHRRQKVKKDAQTKENKKKINKRALRVNEKKKKKKNDAH